MNYEDINRSPLNHSSTTKGRGTNKVVTHHVYVITRIGKMEIMNGYKTSPNAKKLKNQLFMHFKLKTSVQAAVWVMFETLT